MWKLEKVQKLIAKSCSVFLIAKRKKEKKNPNLFQEDPVVVGLLLLIVAHIVQQLANVRVVRRSTFVFTQGSMRLTHKKMVYLHKLCKFF
jgi:hypothetical protein